ncbi:MAG: UDP-3-O-acyl-N-acetylglucosamine deacetylase [Fibrobacter sp.]|nr:UDP-3-O-acyl-N-acetylglucosamine deacetylase [Fibrobacter sp.]
MPACKTLEFSSPSLSYGSANVSVQILSRDSNRAPRISWNVGGRPLYRTDQVKLFESLHFEVCRTTIYSDCGLDAGRDGVSAGHDGMHAGRKCAALATPEHLAPVFLLWPDVSFDVNVEGIDAGRDVNGDAANLVPEIPLMDGSALPFFLALRRDAGVPRELSFYDALVSRQWDLRNAPDQPPYGYVRIEPAETFEVEYRLDRPDAKGFKSCAALSVYGPEDLYGVFQARTFILEREYEQARGAGLLAGATEGCGLLVKSPEDKSLYRVPEEPAMHKILDLLGDLSFARPALPKIRVEILNGGHASHHQILKEVLPYLLKVV